MKALPLPRKRLVLRVARMTTSPAETWVVAVYLFIYFRHTKCRNKERKNTLTERKWRVSLKIETTGLIRRKASSITTHDGYTCTTMTINSKKRTD